MKSIFLVTLLSFVIIACGRSAEEQTLSEAYESETAAFIKDFPRSAANNTRKLLVVPPPDFRFLNKVYIFSPSGIKCNDIAKSTCVADYAPNSKVSLNFPKAYNANGNTYALERVFCSNVTKDRVLNFTHSLVTIVMNDNYTCRPVYRISHRPLFY